MTAIDPTSVPTDAASSPASAAIEQVDAGAGVAAAEQSAPAAAESPSLISAEQPAEASASASNANSPAPAEQSAAPATETPADRPAEDLACLEMNGQNPRGRPFEPGQSGNPLGRPKGSRNRATQVAEALIHGQAEALVGKALEKALAGDSSLLRALCTPLMPRRSERTIEFELPKVETAADAAAASSALLAACSRGEISPAEASEVMELIVTHVRIVDAAVLEQRVVALEEQQQK